jgi:hypothetical protein
MIKFYTKDNHLLLSYTPDFDSDNNWAVKVLEEEGRITLKKTFSFTKEDVYSWPTATEESEDDPFNSQSDVSFVFGTKTGSYYKLRKGLLINKFDIYIHEDVSVDESFFVADSKLSIFKVLQPLVSSDIYIGGTHSAAIPEYGFIDLIKKFPTPYEKTKYVKARVSSVLREYFENIKDEEKSYHQYINKKVSRKGADLQRTFKDFELVKYESILEKLQGMLDTEDGYSEKQWQEEILQILLLLYPKYIYVFREVPIKDKNIQEKFLDYMLVDSSGYTDIVEIKRPFGKCILTENKYRNNFIPLRELSGTIMQLEKYIYYLNRWGPEGERFLTNKYRQQLPDNFEIKITNPNGIIIMGREYNLSMEQKADFEVVKRKYKNVVDIITYDNLLERLRCTIEQIQKL